MMKTKFGTPYYLNDPLCKNDQFTNFAKAQKNKLPHAALSDDPI